MRLAFLTQLWNSKVDFTDSLMTGEVRNIEATLNVRTSLPSQRNAKLTALCLQSTLYMIRLFGMRIPQLLILFIELLHQRQSNTPC